MDGFKLIGAKGDSVYLGSNLTTVPAGERPQMLVLFDYDFWFSKHEVTCGEFKSVMDGRGFVPECESDSLPVTDVTFYDAVLFANEKSKALGLDTAYRYTSAVKDNLGHCTYLEGYAFDPQSTGMRLPTEAEWMFVSRWHWDTQHSWNAENSGDKPHDVCTALPGDAICDMAGNVMEWVNDRLSPLHDSEYVDFIGRQEATNLEEIVIKGGSFRNAESGLNYYSRGDVYFVTPISKSDYVGFRLAFGAIPSASWSNGAGGDNSSGIKVLVGSSAVRKLTGKGYAKLAFRDDVSGNLSYVDFSYGNPLLVEIKDSIDSYHPEISPDGNKVAFSTGFEGVSGKSSVYVRNLDASGSGLVRLEVENAAIPRWRVLENGDTAIVYVTYAGDNKAEAWSGASTWQVDLPRSCLTGRSMGEFLWMGLSL